MTTDSVLPDDINVTTEIAILHAEQMNLTYQYLTIRMSISCEWVLNLALLVVCL